MIMPRFRRTASLRPINRIKHVFDNSGTLTAATQIDVSLATATDTPTLAVTNSVETGSKINGIYLRVEVASTESDPGAIPQCYMMIIKNPGQNLIAAGIPSPAAVGANDNKRFVIHQEMVMLNNLAGGNPRTLFNGVIVIPKGMRRMAPNDAWFVSLISPQVNIAFCIQAHYKEFR